MSTAARGEIVLERASRSFALEGDRELRERLVSRLRGRGHRRPVTVRALDRVTLRVAPGETLGVIGRNGAGKTSTLRVLAGIVPLQHGRVELGGRVAALLELGAGFGRDFTGRENIELSGALHGLSRAEVAERMDDVIAFSELGEFIEAPIKTYSAGMLVRLGFSIAVHVDADVLLIDEVLAVGDVAFQRKCVDRIRERIAAGTTLVLVSHSPGLIESICRRVIVLEAGQVVFDGPTLDGLRFYHRRMAGEQGEVDVVRSDPNRPYVDGVRLLGDDGSERDVFHAGDAVHMEVTLGVPRPVARARLKLELRDEAGRRLFYTEHRPDTAAGSVFCFDVAAIALLGGSYELLLSADSLDSPSPEVDLRTRLRVRDEPGAEGVVDLRGTWSVAGPARVAS